MLSLTLGPIALPVAPFLVLFAVWGASLLASRLVRQGEVRGADKETSRIQSELAGSTVIHAALFGLLAARLAYLAIHADAYLASPLSALDVRDGGWYAPAGLLAGLAWLAWRSVRWPMLRKPWIVSGVAGVTLWWLASTAVGLAGSPSIPAVEVAKLESGETITLMQAAQGRPVVVNLWATWCAPCRVEMPILAAAQQREAAVGFLFVNQGESPGAVQAYLRKEGLPLREVLLDSGSKLGEAIGSRGIPVTLFYDAQGRQVDAHFGLLNAAALESRLRQLRPSR